VKFIYLGCEGAPDVSTHYGVEFTIGQPAAVLDIIAVGKLLGHPHFKAVEDEPVDDERAVLAEQYAAKFGRKPHHKLSTIKIAEALNAEHD
jgi:hypothetical protein